MDKKELTELVLKSKDGDMDAMEKLLVYAHTSVSYQCRNMLKNEQDAEDMTQEVLVLVYQKLDTLQEPAAFHLWLKKITASRCINALTRTHKELQFAEDEEGHSVLDSLEELDESKVPDKWLDNTETTRMIAEIVESLPDAQRVSTLMFYYSEMSVKEISDAMGVSENTVKSRLNYARKAIKDKVQEYEKQGIKLYGLSPLPFLFFFLRQAAKDSAKPAAAKVMVKEILAEDALAAMGAFGASSSASAGSAAAGTAAGTATASVAGSAASGGLAALISAIPVKVVVGITAAVIAVGSISAVAITAENKKELRDNAPVVSEAPSQGEDQLYYPEDEGEDAAPEDDADPVDAEETETTAPETEETEPEETEPEEPETEEDASTEPAAGENGAGAPETDEGGATEPDDETESTESDSDETEPTGPEDDEDETETEGCAHSYELDESREAVCCFSGFDRYKCTSCGEEIYENVLPPTGEHEGYYVEAGCETYFFCETLDTYIYVSGEHTFVVEDRPPTCDGFGGPVDVCVICGTEVGHEDQMVEPTGHSFQSTVIAPTCVDAGYTLYECADCGWFYKEDIVPATEIHSTVPIEVVQPTQTSQGYTVYECPTCGMIGYDDYTDPITEPLTCLEGGDHSWSVQRIVDHSTIVEKTSCVYCGAYYETEYENTCLHYTTELIEVMEDGLGRFLCTSCGASDIYGACGVGDTFGHCSICGFYDMGIVDLCYYCENGLCSSCGQPLSEGHECGY